MMPRGGEKNRTMCINNDLNAYGSTSDWKEIANNTGRWRGTVEDGAETFMADWREKKKAMADARQTKEATEEAKMVTTRLWYLG